MNCHQLIRNWKEVKGAVVAGLGKLTGGDVVVIAEKRGILLGKTQERCGVERKEAEKEPRDWEASLK
jgi:uncharacterized protein YjbJ (UPF0337 family)